MPEAVVIVAADELVAAIQDGIMLVYFMLL